MVYNVVAKNAISRSSHEERGLKSLFSGIEVFLGSRSSHEERGLKSHPDSPACPSGACRSSHEERGLKLSRPHLEAI